MFNGLINIAVTNAFILYKQSGKATTRSDKFRRLFMHQLAMEMAKPWALKRLENPKLSRTLVTTIKSCFNIVEVQVLQPTPPSGKKRCHICPWKTASKCRTVCTRCHKVVCQQHYRIYCTDCQYM